MDCEKGAFTLSRQRVSWPSVMASTFCPEPGDRVCFRSSGLELIVVKFCSISVRKTKSEAFSSHESSVDSSHFPEDNLQVATGGRKLCDHRLGKNDRPEKVVYHLEVEIVHVLQEPPL